MMNNYQCPAAIAERDRLARREHNARIYAHSVAAAASGYADSIMRDILTPAEADATEARAMDIIANNDRYSDRCPCGIGSALNPCMHCISRDGVAK